MRKVLDPMVMIIQEMVGSVLVAKINVFGDDGYEDAADDPYRLKINVEYGALARCAGYAMGCGPLYGSDEWRMAVGYVRDMVERACAGFDHNNAGTHGMEWIMNEVMPDIGAIECMYRADPAYRARWERPTGLRRVEDYRRP